MTSSLKISDRDSVLRFLTALQDRPLDVVGLDQLVIGFLVACYSNQAYFASELLSEFHSRRNSSVSRVYKAMGGNEIPRVIAETLLPMGGLGLATRPMLLEFFRAFDEEYIDSCGQNLVDISEDIDLISFEYQTSVPNEIYFFVVFRKHWFEGVSSTRLHDLGPRLAKIFSLPSQECPLLFSSDDWFAFIRQTVTSRGGRPVVVLDFQSTLVCDPGGMNEVCERLHTLKKLGTCIVGLYADPWAAGNGSGRLLDSELCKQADFHWVPTPSFSEPFVKRFGRDRIINIPFGTGLHYPVVPFDQCRDERVGFAGGIQFFNRRRFYWHTHLAGHNRFQFSLSSHNDDGLSVWESYSHYLRRIEKTKFSINFSQRVNGMRSLTARALEVIELQRILIQEYTPCMRYLFIPDEHFLEFSSLQDLDSLLYEIDANKDRFSRMSRRAKDFFNAHYSNQKIIEHFAHRVV